MCNNAISAYFVSSRFIMSQPTAFLFLLYFIAFINSSTVTVSTFSSVAAFIMGSSFIVINLGSVYSIHPYMESLTRF
jgi:hypothetical protein